MIQAGSAVIYMEPEKTIISRFLFLTTESEIKLLIIILLLMAVGQAMNAS